MNLVQRLAAIAAGAAIISSCGTPREADVVPCTKFAGKYLSVDQVYKFSRPEYHRWVELRGWLYDDSTSAQQSALHSRLAWEFGGVLQNLWEEISQRYSLYEIALKGKKPKEVSDYLTLQKEITRVIDTLYPTKQGTHVGFLVPKEAIMHTGTGNSWFVYAIPDTVYDCW
ncbi:hypothetical protein HY491_03980 [Candidatus Woesearchaeota archaeon]|nr:hypothetical protein [Candidatus Woesearchaeota archaeon]